MVEIVKNLGEAEKRGLLGNSNSNQNSQNEIGKIVSDVKSIIDGIKELKGANSQVKTNQEINNIQPKETEPQKIPIAILKINEEKLNNFLSKDIKKIFENDNISPETTLKEIVDKWDFLKELLKSEIKKAISEIAKADLEFR